MTQVIWVATTSRCLNLNDTYLSLHCRNPFLPHLWVEIIINPPKRWAPPPTVFVQRFGVNRSYSFCMTEHLLFQSAAVAPPMGGNKYKPSYTLGPTPNSICAKVWCELKRRFGANQRCSFCMTEHLLFQSAAVVPPTGGNKYKPS